MHCVIPHNAGTYASVPGNLSLNLQTSLPYIGRPKLRRNQRYVRRSLEQGGTTGDDTRKRGCLLVRRQSGVVIGTY